MSDLPRYIGELKARISIEELIGGEMALDHAGGNRVGLCPFHNEKTPSFTVYDDRRDGDPHYHCFGCGAHGDVITWQMTWQKVDFWRALDELAAIAGMEEYKGPRKDAPRPPSQTGGEPQGSKKSDASAPRGVGLRGRAGEEAKARRDAFVSALALAIWRGTGVARGTVPAPGTLAEVYFRARGIDVDAIGGLPPSIRFNPALRLSFNPAEPAYRETRPAVICGVQRPGLPPEGGQVVAVHVTYLKPDGREKYEGKPNKRMIGPTKHCAIRLAPAGPKLAVPEGVENGLTVMAEMGLGADGKPVLPIWCAMSIGNICGRGDKQKQRRAPHHPTAVLFDPKTGEIQGRKRLPTEHPDMSAPGIILPELVREVIILADSDSDPHDTRAQYARAVRRWQRERRKVRVAWPPKGTDFNDLAQAKDRGGQNAADAPLRSELSAGA